jgi:hypothetical protein
MIQENFMWLVGYYCGYYSDFKTVTLFVTADEEKAKAYVEKYKLVASKYTEHYGNGRDGYMNNDLLDSKPWYTKVNVK